SVYGRRHRVHPALELGDQVFLVAPVVGREHDLFGRSHSVVGDVEEVAILLEQPHLPSIRPQELADDDHPITPVTGDWAIVELGDLLLEHVDRLVPPLLDDLLLESFGLLAGRGLDLIPRRSFQEAVGLGWEFVGPGFEGFVVVEPEDEVDVGGRIPAVQVLGLGEVGVATHGDPAKAGSAAQVDGLVEILGSLLMRGAVAAAIDQVERFGGVGQRDQERMITPGTVVSDINALFALGVGADEGTVGVQDGFLEKLGWLLGPDSQPRFVDSVHQSHDIVLGEAAAEIPGCGGVGDTHGAQGVEVNLVVAPQFEMLNFLAAGQDVVGDIQDMVGFVVGQMPLEEMEIAVDIADQPGPASQQVNGTDSASGETLDAVRQFVVDVGSGHHRFFAFGSWPILDALEDSPFAFVEDSAVAFSRLPTVAFSGILGDRMTHSKASVGWNGEDVFLPPLFQTLRGFSSFFQDFDQVDLYITLG